MSTASQNKYMRAIGDAFVAWVPYFWRCYWYVCVMNNLKQVYYEESWQEIVGRNEDELYVVYKKWYNSDTIRERVNYILFRYRLGKIMKRHGEWEFVDMSWKTIPRVNWNNWDKVLVFNIRVSWEFTYINI